MSRPWPRGKDSKDGIDWDSFLEMDVVNETFSPIWPEAHQEATLSLNPQPDPPTPAINPSNHSWQADPFPSCQPQDVNIVAESRSWQQSTPMTDMLGEEQQQQQQNHPMYIPLPAPHTIDTYVPPPPPAPSRQQQQTQTINTYIPPASRRLDVIGGRMPPRPLGRMQSINAMLDLHPTLLHSTVAVSNEMLWNGEEIPSTEMQQRSLGSDVQQREQQQPLLLLGAEFQFPAPPPPPPPPFAIDPALELQAAFASEQEDSSPCRRNTDWQQRLQSTNHPHPRIEEEDIDTRLRTALQQDHTHDPSILISSSSTTSPPLKRPFKPKTRRPPRSASTTSEKQGPCLTCGKNYRTSTSPGRCGRCGIKWERSQAGPPSYTLDPMVPDLHATRELLFPVITRGQRRMEEKIDDDDDDDDGHLLEISREEEEEGVGGGVEDYWVNRFLIAMCTPVVEGKEKHNDFDDHEEEEEEEEEEEQEEERISMWSRNQQKTFNQKAKMDRDGDYSPTFVTARLRALWWELVVFHGRGGGGGGNGRGIYPIGGDSAGYAEDLTLSFRERAEAMEGVLKKDKRTCMDVIEGRGVAGFVRNPWGFHRRKDANNGGNVKKKDVLKRGSKGRGEG